MAISSLVPSARAPVTTRTADRLPGDGPVYGIFVTAAELLPAPAGMGPYLDILDAEIFSCSVHLRGWFRPHPLTMRLLLLFPVRAGVLFDGGVNRFPP
ncbi:hypothetical protein [Streptomyces sp. NPDC058545]|uniref:hypothetical protein n=1 Tax=Streptomyces sp. NPDC058545 TaxID=3346544 RepID=UPI0036681A8F